MILLGIQNLDLPICSATMVKVCWLSWAIAGSAAAAIRPQTANTATIFAVILIGSPSFALKPVDTDGWSHFQLVRPNGTVSRIKKYPWGGSRRCFRR